jgi:DnaJ-class molecular chaperone
MPRRERCPRCKGRGWVTTRVNWPAFLFWMVSAIVRIPFFERQPCPACGGTGRTPWRVDHPA